MNDPSFPTGVEDKITFRNVVFHIDIKTIIFTIIAKVVDATNYPERTISKVFKNKYDYSFPGFINFLRITEAKKLLSKLAISLHFI